MQEAVEIVVGPACRADVPVGDRLRAGIADVVVAGAGVVDADRSRERPPSMLGDRLAVRLAEEVPERDVDGRVAAHLGARSSASRDSWRASPLMRLDLQRVAAEQLGRDRLVDVGLDGGGAQERLAEPTSPSSVWTRTQSRLANSPRRIVSSAVIFMSDASPAEEGSLLGVPSCCALRYSRLGRPGALMRAQWQIAPAPAPLASTPRREAAAGQSIRPRREWARRSSP